MASTFRSHRAYLVLLLLCALIFTRVPFRVWVEESPSVNGLIAESTGAEAAAPAASTVPVPPAPAIATDARPFAAPVAPSHQTGLLCILRI